MINNSNINLKKGQKDKYAPPYKQTKSRTPENNYFLSQHFISEISQLKKNYEIYFAWRSNN